MTQPLDELIAEMKAGLVGVTDGELVACNMVHADRGDQMTPEELGEYVKNNVLKSVEDGGTLDRFLFITTKEDGGPDICHIGNGPRGPANAAHIARCSKPNITRLLDALKAKDAEIARLREALLDGLELSKLVSLLTFRVEHNPLHLSEGDVSYLEVFISDEMQPGEADKIIKR